MATIDGQVEVEERFAFDNDIGSRLLNPAEFKGIQAYSDAYYDTRSLSLAKADRWLRSREGAFELKLSKSEVAGDRTTAHREVDKTRKIKSLLGISAKGPLISALPKQGYSLICAYNLTRVRFKKGIFTLDVDTAHFDDFSYTVVEVELKVPEKEKEKAKKDIRDFANKYGLVSARGKLFEYFYRSRPDIYRQLCAEWGVKKL